MEKFYFEIPSMERKEEVLEYLKEFIEYNSDINGTGGLERCSKGMPYEEWLKDNLANMKIEYDGKSDKVPATTYLMIRESDNKIVGMVNIRHCLNRILSVIGGHIGGSIRPTERGKGYSKIQLYLCLLECKKLGVNEAMIDCEKINIKSEKAIQAIGAVFQREFYYQPKKSVIRNYLIDVDKSLEIYKDSYGKQVLKKKRK